MLIFLCSGGERWQDNCCLCWWSRVPSLQWHQGAPTTSFGWDSSLLWRLYPLHIFFCLFPNPITTSASKCHQFNSCSFFQYQSIYCAFSRILYFKLFFLWQIFSDKKNENKEVAVDDFLPSTKAHEAIQHSMYVLFLTIQDLINCYFYFYFLLSIHLLIKDLK